MMKKVPFAVIVRMDPAAKDKLHFRLCVGVRKNSIASGDDVRRSCLSRSLRSKYTGSYVIVII